VSGPAAIIPGTTRTTTTALAVTAKLFGRDDCGRDLERSEHWKSRKRCDGKDFDIEQFVHIKIPDVNSTRGAGTTI
jgi:hypothetical protein